MTYLSFGRRYLSFNFPRQLSPMRQLQDCSMKLREYRNKLEILPIFEYDNEIFTVQKRPS